MIILLKMFCSVVLLVSSIAVQVFALPRDTGSVLTARYGDFKEECFPRPSGGCSCNIKDAQGRQSVQSFSDDQECKIPIHDMIETAIKKQAVNEEIKDKFGAFKENCFPKPSGGCKCNEKIHDKEVVHVYENDEDCRVNAPSSAQKQTMENKKKLNEEIKQRYGSFKENCFPKPSGGCRCNEKDANGNDIVHKYDSDAECRVVARKKRATSSAHRPSQNVRDPVRERAQANYAAVLNELNEKFKGLKEGCFPRVKGCLCVIGKDKDGREITERRMKDRDCKCQPGERGKGCPVKGA